MADALAILWWFENARAEDQRRYGAWRTAFYTERSRRLEGARFSILADSDAEAVYLLTARRDGESNG